MSIFLKPEFSNGICVKRGEHIINGTIIGKFERGNYKFRDIEGNTYIVEPEDIVLWALPSNRMVDDEDDGYPD